MRQAPPDILNSWRVIMALKKHDYCLKCEVLFIGLLDLMIHFFQTLVLA